MVLVLLGISLSGFFKNSCAYDLFLHVAQYDAAVAALGNENPTLKYAMQQYPSAWKLGVVFPDLGRAVQTVNTLNRDLLLVASSYRTADRECMRNAFGRLVCPEDMPNAPPVNYYNPYDITSIREVLAAVGESGANYIAEGIQETANNLSQDATSPDVALRYKAVAFANAAAGDFHLFGDPANPARGTGQDLSSDSHWAFSNDIDGQARTGPDRGLGCRGG